MYTVVDTEICGCCSSMREERRKGKFDTEMAAAEFLVDKYNAPQLLQGKFDRIHVRCPEYEMKASKYLEYIGYTRDKVVDRVIERQSATMRWLNLPLPDTEAMRANLTASIEKYLSDKR